MYGETYDVSVGNGNIKYTIGKYIFTVNFPLKLFRAVVTNADTESQFLHTLFDTYLDHRLTNFEPYRMVRKVNNVQLFDKKTEIFKAIYDKVLTPFCKTL